MIVRKRTESRPRADFSGRIYIREFARGRGAERPVDQNPRPLAKDARRTGHPLRIFRRTLTFFAFFQPGDHAEIFQRSGVAFHFAAAGEFAEQAAHDFSAASFG
jgi:hypothetical protein